MCTSLAIAVLLATAAADGRSNATQLPAVELPAVQAPVASVIAIAETNMSLLDTERDAAARTAMGRGLTWLRAHTSENGGWLSDLRAAPTDATTSLLSPVGAAVSALGLKSFVQAGVDPATDPMLRALVANLLARQETDGRFDDGNLSTYVTAAVVTALASLPPSERVATAMHNGVESLRQLQWDETDNVDPSLDWYGGAGYGKHGRPDLSSTQWLLEGLHAAGDCSDSRGPFGCDCDNDPARQRAIAFLTRCQNAPSNPADWAGTDGGFVYTAAGGGESMASQAAGEGRYGETMPEGEARSLRSYGSMTYAGYKSLLFAGLSPDDPRVQAALDWIRAHWTMTSNPGMGKQGWFYYLHGLARAMAAGGHTTLMDADGVDHDWRAELADTLVEAQQPDGSWVNEESRWLEGNAELATIYAVLTLQETLKPPPMR